jgi:aspartyl/asparaginyl-tRNA synthetase
MVMKLVFGSVEHELKFTSLAVEKLEEQYDKSIDDIFKGELKFKAKELNFMMWAFANTDMPLDEFKKEMAKYYDYQDIIEILTSMLGDGGENPNAQTPAEATDAQ